MNRYCKKYISVVVLAAVMLFNFLPSFVFALESRLTLTNLVVAPSDKTAVISWETSIATLGFIEYGLTDEYGSRLDEVGTKKVSHSVTIIGLQPEEDYHYRIVVRSDTQTAETFDAVFKTKKFNDSVAPTITDVRANYVTGTTATITWYTDEPTDSVVVYGKTNAYGSRATGAGNTTIHDVTLQGLIPATTYHFQVQSRDRQGNNSTYIDMSFQTSLAATAEKLPLEITGIRPLTSNDELIRDTSVTIEWQTNKLASGTVIYGTNSNPGSSVAEPLPRDFFHSVTIEKLTPDTQYYFKVQSTDVFNATLASQIYSIRTRPEGSQKPIPSGSIITGSASGSTSNTSSSGSKSGSTITYNDLPNGLEFYASFDTSLNADMSRADGTAREIKNPRLTSNNGGVYGEALDPREGNVAYDLDNLSMDTGTLLMWYKPAEPKEASLFYTLFTLNPDYRRFTEKYFYLEHSQYSASMHFALEDAGDGDFTVDFVPDSTTNVKNWHFVAVMWQYDGGSVKAYYDGKMVDLSKNNSMRNTLKLAPLFGQEFFLGSPAEGTFAYIDEFGVFSYMLSRQELDQIYKHGIRGFRSTQNPSGGDDSVLNPPTTTDGGTVLGSSNSDYTWASALIREKGTPDVFAVLNGKKHMISSPRSFEIYGYKWSNVKEVSKAYFDSIPYARLLREPHSPVVYYLYQRPNRQWLKIPIPSPTAFISYPTNYWGDIVLVNDLDINSYPDVQLIKTATESGVYYLKNGEKRLFASGEAFEAHKFSWSEIAVVSLEHLNGYINGDPIDKDTAL